MFKSSIFSLLSFLVLLTMTLLFESCHNREAQLAVSENSTRDKIRFLEMRRNDLGSIKNKSDEDLRKINFLGNTISKEKSNLHR